ncbi:extracellular solute-binding protein [Oceanobacillus salinisoli]|uniref:extracellular solute-binding protein n=1 Tax=Oceanobacillus salinisoli TaxID=2678611 RepID=UPI001E296558|nr:extracellular solute-binding protein [Oceanobacillus salinisoli]
MKRILFLTILVMISIVAAACGQTESNGDAKGNSSSDETLVIYTNSASDGRGDWLTEKAQEAGFSIEIVEGGGGEIINRLIAEKNNPLADIVYGPTEADFNHLKDENVLSSYEIDWIDGIPEGSYDEDGYFYPLVSQPKILLYNSDIYSKETAPQDFTDLWKNEAFHGKYHVNINMGSNSNRAVIAGILVRYLDPEGELGVSQEGWDAIQAYFDHGYKTPEGEHFFGNLASGDVPISFIWASGVKGMNEEFNHQAGIVYPEIGMPTTVEQVGIVQNNPDKFELAQEFIEWFGSGEVQGQWAQEFGSLPIHKEALEQAVPEMIELGEKGHAQDIDWQFVNDHIDEWVEKIELEIL